MSRCSRLRGDDRTGCQHSRGEMRVRPTTGGGRFQLVVGGRWLDGRQGRKRQKEVGMGGGRNPSFGGGGEGGGQRCFQKCLERHVQSHCWLGRKEEGGRRPQMSEAARSTSLLLAMIGVPPWSFCVFQFFAPQQITFMSSRVTPHCGIGDWFYVSNFLGCFEGAAFKALDGYGVECLGCRVQGLGFRFQGSGSRVWGVLLLAPARPRMAPSKNKAHPRERVARGGLGGGGRLSPNAPTRPRLISSKNSYPAEG